MVPPGPNRVKVCKVTLEFEKQDFHFEGANFFNTLLIRIKSI